jgi:hypothetical protein
MRFFNGFRVRGYMDVIPDAYAKAISRSTILIHLEQKISVSGS